MSVIVALPVVEKICRDLNYTRAHVVNILRLNARSLGAKRHKRSWYLPRASAAKLRKLVAENSGPRYKLGEKKEPQRS